MTLSCFCWNFLFALALLPTYSVGTAGQVLPLSPQERPQPRQGRIERGSLDLQGFLYWRNVGPNRGGRSIAVAGSLERPNEYYFGATGGGLWRTEDGGTTWVPVTDGQIGSSSVGAVAIAASNPDVVYLGMGESQLRGNVMQGDGVYRSDDGGNTWSHIGLERTQVISRIRIHPEDSDVVYVAALGPPFRPQGPGLPENHRHRGVYRSKNGGRTWEKILYRNERTGAVDLTLHPHLPNVLFATLWEVYRQPWKLWSGGPGSGIFKSTDGGDSWDELTRRPGFPGGPLGKITVAVSPADTERVYANVEAPDGGLYRSDDGGVTWHHVNDNRALWQRAFYFLRIVADPQDQDVIYVLNYELQKSTDGGKTFSVIQTPHVDHHDLWIDPQNPDRMISANDGGAAVTVNGGATWTEQDFPTAQMYGVTLTKEVPYHICGAQQDNTTICIASDQGWHQTDLEDPLAIRIYSVGGGENASIASKPTNADIFFAGATNTLTRFDRAAANVRDVQPLPFMVMGEPAKDMPERWNWVFPIAFSPADPGVLYAGSQHLWRTHDDGNTWERISPDLTRADLTTLGNSGGMIILDQDGPEIYATLTTVAPSHLHAGTIWVGSDDGMVHLTRDGGDTWLDVTPPDMLPFTEVTCVEASPHDVGRALVAGNRYQLDDRTPFLWVTQNHGKTWSSITSGIQANDFLHCIREDPRQPGLLYAGTEHGPYLSYDLGSQWYSLSLNLPDLSVIDLAVQGHDLIIATHGRSFFVLHEVAPLRELAVKSKLLRVHLFQPPDGIRRFRPVPIDYYLAEHAPDLRIEILAANGDLVRVLGTGPDAADVPSTPGLHRVEWNLRHTGAVVFDGIILEGGNPARGPWGVPGGYQVKLTEGQRELVRTFNVALDPRLRDVSAQNLEEQFDLASGIRDRTSDANRTVIAIRALRKQVERRIERAEEVRGRKVTLARLQPVAAALLDSLRAVEGELYQIRNQSPKDKIAFPIKLNNRLSGLRYNLELGDAAPTAAHYEVFGRLEIELDRHLDRWEHILHEQLPVFNEIAEGMGLCAIDPRGFLVPQRTPENRD